MLKQLFNLISISALVILTSCAVMDGKETAGEYLDDSTITMRVKSALAENPNVTSYDINVKTMKGVVQLSGFVNDKAAVSVAGAVAANVKGVKKVRNSLIARARKESLKQEIKEEVAKIEEEVSDSVITTKIKVILFEKEGFDSTKISVRTDAGRVLLGGSVPTKMEAERAEKLASEVKGVKGVQNQIQVQQ